MRRRQICSTNHAAFVTPTLRRQLGVDDVHVAGDGVEILQDEVLETDQVFGDLDQIAEADDGHDVGHRAGGDAVLGGQCGQRLLVLFVDVLVGEQSLKVVAGLVHIVQRRLV